MYLLLSPKNSSRFSLKIFPDVQNCNFRKFYKGTLFKKRGNEYVHGLSNFNYNNQSGACEYLLYYLVIQRVYRSDKVDGGKGIKRVGRG